MRKRVKGCLHLVMKAGVAPVLFYTALFSILTFPLMERFSTHFFADTGDGLKNVWNIWWVNKAVSELHQSPWFTSYLHYPSGVSLLGHTLNPFNGFLAILLLKSMTLTQAHNFIVVFSFAVGGLTAFWLCYRITRSYWGSIIGGYIFTFSNYHFAHAEGHLNLVALEWLPLFALCWYALLAKPGIPLAVASALVLYAVLLCDYYYFVYAVMLGLIVTAWYAIHRRDFLFLVKRRHLFPMAAFLVTVLATAGPLLFAFMLLNLRDPLAGAHSPTKVSLDLLAPLIPGGHWRFAHLTQAYWSRLPGNIHESSVHLGLSVLWLLLYVWAKRRHTQVEGLHLWYFALILFVALSLGPVLHIWGNEVPYLRLPYALLAKAFPPLQLSGCPVRMMVMAILAASVICAVGFRKLLGGTAYQKLMGAALIVLLFVEYLPKPVPSTYVSPPAYLAVLEALPKSNVGMIDIVDQPSLAMYYQISHQRPLAFGFTKDPKALGFLARMPKSVVERELPLRLLLRERRYLQIWRAYNIRYLVADISVSSTEETSHPKVLWKGNGIALYDLAVAIPSDSVVN